MITNMLAILCLIAAQETRGEADPRNSVGDNGAALGKYQMHAGAVSDVNDIFVPVAPYTLADRADPVKGELLAIGYVIILDERFRRRMHRDATASDICGMWRYGARGWMDNAGKE